MTVKVLPNIKHTEVKRNFKVLVKQVFTNLKLNYILLLNQIILVDTFIAGLMVLVGGSPISAMDELIDLSQPL